MARALDGIDQARLASLAGIARKTISELERGQSKGSPRILAKIERYFSDRHIDFVDYEGVRRRPTGVIRVLKSVEGFKEFMDDVYNVAHEYGGDIYLFNSRPHVWHKWLGRRWYKMHADRMRLLGDRIRMRIMVQEEEDYFILDFAEYRRFTKGQWKEKIIYAYGSKLAFLDFSHGIHIIILNQAEFADSMRILFDLAWQHAKKVEKPIIRQ